MRDSIRALARAPGLTFIIVASLALGTGANAAVYSAVDALLFRGPAGVQDPSTLVDVYTSQITGALTLVVAIAIAPPTLRALRVSPLSALRNP